MNQLALQTAQDSGTEIDVFRIGEVFAKSGYFSDAKDASQAIVKIIAGREIGIGTMASMTGIHIVQNKPTLSANLIASLIKNKNSGYNYRVREMSETACEIEFFEKSESIGKSRFTLDEAKTAGLTSRDIWKKYPKNMLFARAISNGAKWFCPDVFNGVPIYTPDELGAKNLNEDGDIIPMSAPATVHRLPNKSELVEAAKPANPLDAEITELCKTLNAENDSIKWTSKNLREYACQLLDIENYSGATDEMKSVLVGDLTGRLDQVREAAAIQDLNSGEVIEGEPVEEEAVF